MVDYNDIPQANALHSEQALISQGVAIIDGGGSVSSFTLSPAQMPLDPFTPPSQTVMAVFLQTINPTPAMMASIRAALVERSAEIDAELAALGVTNPPEAL